MANFSFGMLVGNLVRTPELKYTSTQMAICKFTVAVNHKSKNEQGVTFMDCTAFGKTAELIGDKCQKGECVLVSGKIRQENWETKDGQKRSKIGLLVDTFQFCGNPKGGEEPRPRTDEPENPF